MSAQSQPPMKNHQLYSVLWKWSDSPIDRSHDSTDQPIANSSTDEHGELALQRMRRVDLATLVRRSRARMRARMFAAHFAPHSGTRPTSSRSDV